MSIALVTVATSETLDAVVALSQSLPRADLDPKDLHIVASQWAVERFGELPLVPASTFNDSEFPIAEILTEGDQCAFALPRVMESLLHQHEACIYIGPGLLTIGGLAPLVEVAQPGGVGLFPVTATKSPMSLQPWVDLVERLPTEIDYRIVVTTRAGYRLLDDWKAATREAILDIRQRPIHGISTRFLTTALGRSEVAVGGEHLYRIADAGLALREAASPSPAVLVCDELFAAARSTHDADEFDMFWHSATMGVHDTSGLDSILAHIRTSSHFFDRGRFPTPLYILETEIRRALDPFGRKWPAGCTAQFREWLFESNPNGHTRLADIVIAADTELHRRFADARANPSAFKEYLATGGVQHLGFDPYSRQVEPFRPEPESADVDPPSGLGTRVAWRWNVLKTLIPGYSRRLWYRNQEKLIGRPSFREYKLEAPRMVPVEPSPTAWGSPPKGINVVGMFRSESGLGQASRATLAALRHLRRPFTFVDTSDRYPSRNNVDPHLPISDYGQPGDVNLLHVNSDELVTMRHDTFRHRLAGHYNVGFWFWEAADLPESSRPAFAVVDELWVASHYLQDVFGQYGRVPVRWVGLAADLPQERIVDRRSLGWREEELVFFFAYDALSSYGRKNPGTTIQAFKNAYGPDFDNVRLVLKVSNLGRFASVKRAISELIDGIPQIQLIDRYLTRGEVLDLMAAADVYMSLHAAEGLGLTILEAMALGTPAICTGYSGNMDFTTPENSWLIDFDLMQTEEQTGPYPAGSVWARPSVDQAVEVMRHIRQDPSLIKAKGALAHRDAIEAASTENYAQRLDLELRRIL